MSEWQPIETAPRDGTRILGTDGRRVEVIAYAQHKIQKTSTPWRADHQLGRQVWNEPTHWMPLPEPPK